MSALEDRALSAGLIPDRLLRRIIAARVQGLVESFDRLPEDEREARMAAVTAEFESGPVAVCTDDANRQHYGLPPEFFETILGPRLKYSSCYWPDGTAGLAQAEEAMLELMAERAGLEDGQDILDLGCGWGSFALWAAERYPRSRVMAMSNSQAQRAFIEGRRDQKGLENLEVQTADVSVFEPSRRFDRVVSVEMLEHVRNHRVLMERIAGWLEPEGRLFIHVFCHSRHLYAFEPRSTGSWMSRYFFSGGMMPSWDYLAGYQSHLTLTDRWSLNGLHYARTLRAWLENLDSHEEEVMDLLKVHYGPSRASLWFARWRIFFMACEQTFALDSGRAYLVGHYLFSKPPVGPILP